MKRLGYKAIGLQPSGNYEYSKNLNNLDAEIRDDIFPYTLQEALFNNPDKFKNAFDVVTVFKYNVPFLEKCDFIKCLAQSIKQDGTLHITSVEPERIYKFQNHEDIYLIDDLKMYFSEVNTYIVHVGNDCYGAIDCKNPILDLTMSF